MKGTTELQVGIFTVVATGLLIFAWLWTWDGVRPGERSYQVTSEVTSADGLWEGTPVRLAGVEIGGVNRIGVSGTRAELVLDIRDGYPLPKDSAVELRSTGMLGDRFVAIVPGTSETPVKPGGRLAEGGPPMDLDAMGRQAEGLAAELSESAAAIREVIADEQNIQRLESTLADLASLTRTLAEVSSRNQRDIDALFDNLRHVSGDTRALVADASPKVAEQLAALGEATDKLNGILEDVGVITERLEQGEGSLGALLSERELVEQLDATLVSTQNAMDSVGGLMGGDSPRWVDAWTMGRVFATTDGVQTGGTLGASFGPDPNTWLSAELIVPPSPALAPPRGSVQLHRRFGVPSLHVGMKEGGEGVGGALHLAGDRLRVQADAFDFLGRYADRPDGVPNLRVGVRAEPIRRLWLEVAGEELLPGEVRPQGFVAIGVHLTSPPRGATETEATETRTVVRE